MQKVTEAFKVQRAGPGRQDGQKKAAAEQLAVPSGRGVGPAAAAAAPEVQKSTEEQDEAALRQFDLNSKYGPCSGMSRLERWERAVKLGLDPPAEVRELVLRHGEGTPFNRCLWEHSF